MHCILVLLGPGEYDSQGLLGLGKGGLICYKDHRFKGHKSIVPGPGAYQVNKIYTISFHHQVAVRMVSLIINRS